MAQKLYRGLVARRKLQKLKEEKRRKDEAERKERERVAAQRANMASKEREELERQEAEERERQKREEQEQARRDEESARKADREQQAAKAEEKKQKQEQERVKAQEKERSENLAQLGLQGDLNDLEHIISKAPNAFAAALPPPAKEDKGPQDLTQIDDMDLLDAMMNEDFFGDIPSFVASELDQLAGSTYNLSFDFLSAPPPPPEDDFDSIPPPVGAADDFDIPPPPPPVDFMDLPPPLQRDSSGEHAPAPATQVRKQRERPTNVDRVTAKLVTPPNDPPKIINAEQIESYLWRNYAIRMFKSQKKGKKASDMYGWSKKPIDGAVLSSVQGEDAKTAEQIFTKLMTYMGEVKKAAGDNQVNAKFIVSKGISVKTLRDEIYAQICKQTTDNPTRESKKKGWEVMAYCVSFFPPSEELLPFLASYILAEMQQREGEKDIATYCIRALRRTMQNGAKKVPPSTAEMEAIDKRQPAPLRVKLMDGTDLLLLVDSATTAGETMQAIVNTIKMKDTQGFGLFEVYNNIARRLASNDHLLDAIAKSENLQKQMASRNVKISFNLLFKKSIFLDNKDYFEDLVCRDLIYHQLSHDVAEGAFPVPSDVAVRLAAFKQVAESKSGRLFDYKKVIAQQQQPEKSDGEWKDAIGRQITALSTTTPDQAIDEWLALAARQPMYGATLFPDVEVKDQKGVQVKDMSISRTGVHFHDRGSIIPNTTYSIRDVKEWMCQDPQLLNLRISTLNNAVISVVKEGEAYRMAAVLKEYVDILQGIGWATANIDFNSPDPDLLSFKRGDIIFIKDKMENGWFLGEFNKVGAIREDNFDLLLGNPAETGAVILANPPKRPEAAQSSPVPLRKELTEGGFGDMSGNTLNPNSAATLSAMTLSPMSTIRFRASKRRTMKPGDADAHKTKMVFSSSPISNSILDLSSSLNKEAKECHAFIMKWMGDIPNKSGEKVVTDLIQLGIDHEELRDEIYTQIIKQTTQNPRPESNLKGWELMAMLCAFFPPSPEILPMVMYHIANPPAGQDFRKMAEKCIQNQKVVAEKGQRKRSPIPEEVKAIVAGQPVVPRAFTLDGNRKAFKSTTHTTIREVSQDLCQIFEVPLTSGFGLCEFNADLDIITPLPEDAYVLDMYNLWTQQNKMDTTHKFLFRRRILTDDPQKDLLMPKTHSRLFEPLFHEIIYDLRQGKIVVELDDLPMLVALLLQIKEGDHESPITRQSVTPLLPKNYQAMNIPEDVITRTSLTRMEVKGQSAQQCKMSILNILSQKPLYGACVFTNINVKTVRNTFTKCWLAVTAKGISVHDAHEKEPKHFFPHDQITRVLSEKDTFVVISGNLMKDDKWTFTGVDVNRAEDIYRLSKQVDAKNNYIPDLLY